jgi:hypothetical protein
VNDIKKEAVNIMEREAEAERKIKEAASPTDKTTEPAGNQVSMGKPTTSSTIRN